MERDKILAYYKTGIEKDRLDLEYFRLEGVRTREIIGRYLPGNKLEIADIGGGAGFYAFWLQEMGHRVHLVDLSPDNIELVNNYSDQSGIRLSSCKQGDATRLDLPDEHFDMVLLLGPLYHLIEKKERLKALSEARRILKPGGKLIAAVISRYASLFDGFRRNLIADEQFENILLDDLRTGIHRNETTNLEYFTTAYFHTPDEIRNEISESGLALKKLIAVESVAWLLEDLREKLSDPHYDNKLKRIIKVVESDNDLMAASPHILAIAEKE